MDELRHFVMRILLGLRPMAKGEKYVLIHSSERIPIRQNPGSLSPSACAAWAGTGARLAWASARWEEKRQSETFGKDRIALRAIQSTDTTMRRSE